MANEPEKQQRSAVAHADENDEKPIPETQIKETDYSRPTNPNDIDLRAGEVHNLDQAALFLHEHNFTQSDLQTLLQDEQAQKKIRRRVDWVLMPLLCGTYMLQYIDKQTLSYSAVFDLFESTGTTKGQYSWLASM